MVRFILQNTGARLRAKCENEKQQEFQYLPAILCCCCCVYFNSQTKRADLPNETVANADRKQ